MSMQRQTHHAVKLLLLLHGWLQVAATELGGQPTVPISSLVRHMCSGIGTTLEVKEHHPWWVANLEEAVVLRSPHDRRNKNVTLVEPLSVERLGPLRLQCSVWPGVIAAAVYLPVVDNRVVSKDGSKFQGMALHKALEKLKKEYEHLADRCIIDLGIYVERLPPGREFDPLLAYPNNALRNKALELVDTEAVLLLDGDFIPGPLTFLQRLNSDAGVYRSLRSIMRENNVIVVNSMDVDDPWHPRLGLEERLQVVLESLHSSKQQIATMVSRYRMFEFQPVCHVPTNFSKWVTADEPYGILYDDNDGRPGLYEPYILALRDALPWWDERFRGYYFNKQAYTYQLYRFNLSFVVHPEAFVVHYPHPEVSDLQIQNSTAREERMRLYYAVLPHEFDYQAGGYRPVRADHPSNCTALTPLAPEQLQS